MWSGGAGGQQFVEFHERGVHESVPAADGGCATTAAGTAVQSPANVGGGASRPKCGARMAKANLTR